VRQVQNLHAFKWTLRTHLWYKNICSYMNKMFTYGMTENHRSHVLQRNFSADMPVAVGGNGPYIFDAAGRKYLDASGGAAVSCLGHGHPRIVQAIVEQAQKLAFAHTSFFTNEPLERLADFLVQRAPEGIQKTTVVCDGSEAVEAAIKLARQYWTELGESSRSVIMSRRLSYHGITLGALAASGHEARRQKYTPYLSHQVEFIAPCYAYRNQRDGESDLDYGLRAANELEKAILRLGPQSVAAFIAETVGGATAGCLTPAAGYFRRIREICDRYSVLWIADEVMCGMGRTGTLFACEQEGVAPDLIAIAKGLGAGYQSIGAVLVGRKIVEAIERGSGVLGQGHTYMGHPIACAAALAVQQVIEEDHLLDNVRRMGQIMQQRLRDEFAGLEHVGDIRGRGLFWALELVEDQGSKGPFPASAKIHARIKHEAFHRGLICYPSGGTADGISGDHVLLAPPYIVDEAHIEEIVSRLGQTLDSVLKGVKN
jgi:adenosylmethionine-8-amino-7-oxononanoate aminotransferase